VLTIPEEEALWENEKLGSNSPKVLCESMGKKLTNHSARNTLVEKLRAANVER